MKMVHHRKNYFTVIQKGGIASMHAQPFHGEHDCTRSINKQKENNSTKVRLQLTQSRTL